MAEGMPLVELMVLPCEVDVDQRLIVQGDRTHLVVGLREHLDEIIPVGLILPVLHIAEADLLDLCDVILHDLECIVRQMIM